MRRLLSWVLALGALIGVACSGGSAPGTSTGATEPAAATTPDTASDEGADAKPSGPAVQPLRITHDGPTHVGSEVRAVASNLPAGKTLEIGWKTVQGGWVIEDYYHFRGKKYEETTLPIGRFPIDANGAIDVRFKVPEDYGGVHDVVATVDGTLVAQGGVDVKQGFEMSPLTGPIGTPIEIKVTGLGWRTMESTWVVNWDNNLVGFVSAASSKGSAVARLRATGPAGAHVVKLLTGYQGQGYLNHEQSPIPHLPRPQFTFTTTEGGPLKAAYAEPYQKQPVPETELNVPNAKLALSATQGPVASRVTLSGEGFPAGASLQLVWQTYVGNRVSGAGYAPQEDSIGSVTVGADGRLNAPITIPDDLGGLHGLALRDGEKTLARVYYVIETSIVGISATSGPVGTPISIHLKGVGWTEYDNIYVVTFDNAYMGYVCGFNSQGDVVFNFTAAGAPGKHVIDMYPGIYQGPPTEPQLLYRIPQLTYADDHPGNKIPALRFMFEITSGAAR